MNRRAKILVAFGFVYIVWGSTFVAIRYAVRVVHPALLSGLRFMIASLALMAYIAIRGGSLRLARRDVWKVVLLGFVMFSVNTTLVNYGSRMVPAGVTALMLATIPLMIGVLDSLLPHGRGMSTTGWIATISGFLGLAILISGSIMGQPSANGRAWACGGLIVAAAAWAGGSVAAQRMTFDAPPLVLSAWQMLVGGSINLLGASISGITVSHWSRSVWIAIFYLAICGSLASYTSYLFLLRNVRLSAVATYAYINPVVAVLLGGLLLNESLYPVQLAGMAIVLVSVAIVVLSGHSPRANIETEPEYRRNLVERTDDCSAGVRHTV